MFDCKFYRMLLDKFKEYGFSFNYFDNFKDKSCILRHDIDVSPKLALEMAKLEHKLGVNSTFFFMVRSPFYNLFSRANDNIVRQIIDMGHCIGLHYDEGYYSKNISLQELVDSEILMLEKNFDTRINVVSFHQPSKKIIDNSIGIKQINTYDKSYFRDIKYVSDSNMIFKDDIIDIITSGVYPKIQVLIHPIWWMACGNDTEEKFISAIKCNFEQEQEQVVNTERAYGNRKDIKFI
ncbi:hypothetical protein [Campylobacter concisus]|uniref:hypothetical protein n=1 Tax=Campylobacter concisus TaxID=199 RepID=UPI00122C17D8|nr:hypothetical protein [Campylobacter concisus]